MSRFALFLAVSAALFVQELSGPVTRVVDGDTIEVVLDGETERVRYIGINTPELNDRRPSVRELAFAARAANARLVEGRTVRLELDVEKRDRYGRLLAYVFVGDTMVNEMLVGSGYAGLSTYPPNLRYVERFVEAERFARGIDNRVGAPERTGDDWGPDSRQSIAPVEAAGHIGETVTVCGIVASTRYLRTGRQPTFLNFGRPYPEQDVTVIIWGEYRARFDVEPEEVYRNRRVCVTGRVEVYRGTIQIEVREPNALRIMR